MCDEAWLGQALFTKHPKMLQKLRRLFMQTDIAASMHYQQHNAI
jgi:hypothetical protein